MLGALARRLALQVTRRTRFTWDDHLVDAAFGPARLLLGLVTFAAMERALRLAPGAQAVLDGGLRIAAVVLFSWIGLRAIRFGAAVLTVASEGINQALSMAGHEIPGVKQILYGIALGAAIMFMPNGIWPIIARRLGFHRSYDGDA